MLKVGQILQIFAWCQQGELFKNADKMALIGIAMVIGNIDKPFILAFVELIEGGIEPAYFSE